MGVNRCDREEGRSVLRGTAGDIGLEGGENLGSARIQSKIQVTYQAPIPKFCRYRFPPPARSTPAAILSFVGIVCPSYTGHGTISSS
jgi:hypothetical protein